MKYRQTRIDAVKTALSALTERVHEYGGKNANNIPDDVAARMSSRARRAAAKRAGNHMSLAELVNMSARNRRARITHPHKRVR